MNDRERNERMERKADLHCHTDASDNTYGADEVVAAAKEAGLTYLGITDHDTTAGLAEALRCGERHGIEIVPGIEISAADRERGRRAHILGYYIEPDHPAIRALCDPINARRSEASRLMVAKLAEAGYRISWEDVSPYAARSTAVFKQHIMHALMDRGYCDDIYGPLEKKLFGRGGEGRTPGIALVPIEYADAREAIRAVRAAGGVPVLAHPGQLRNFEAVEEWVACGLEGIEAFHPSHTQEDTDRALELASRYGLAVTGGADFHGGYGAGRHPLGSVFAGEEAVDELKRRKARRDAIGAGL